MKEHNYRYFEFLLNRNEYKQFIEKRYIIRKSIWIYAEYFNGEVHVLSCGINEWNKWKVSFKRRHNYTSISICYPSIRFTLI